MEKNTEKKTLSDRVKGGINKVRQFESEHKAVAIIAGSVVSFGIGYLIGDLITGPAMTKTFELTSGKELGKIDEETTIEVEAE